MFKTYRKDGSEVKPGDIVASGLYPDEPIRRFIGGSRPPSPGRDGKVLVMENGMSREFYQRVFDLSVSEEPWTEG